MKKLPQFLVLFLFFTASVLTAQNTSIISKKAFTIGEVLEIKSEILDENRILNIYLPNGYSKDSIKKYPVIYLLDGSVDEDFIHISGLVQFGSFSWINILPESIVVGIANVDRKRDYTFPTSIKRDKKDFPSTGGSAKFIQFIQKEVQPLIDNTYHSNTVKTLIGQSLGGLLATEILFNKPDMFDNYVIVSPSLWWDNESLLKKSPVSYVSKKSIFVAVGKEGKVMEQDAKSLYKKLQASKKKHTKLHFEFFEKQDHGDVLHLAAYHAFLKIFKTKKKEN